MCDLCAAAALPVARALLTYCLFAWTSAIYQKLLIVSTAATVASVMPSNFTRKPSSKTTNPFSVYINCPLLKLYTYLDVRVRIYIYINSHTYLCMSTELQQFNTTLTLPKTSTLGCDVVIDICVKRPYGMSNNNNVIMVRVYCTYIIH